ncbi:MAG: type III-B CRISPR module-associated protein Cmr5 [Candidatus Bathyarchaeia archaeon]
MLKTLEQERADYAWECIQDVKNEKDKQTRKNYNSYVKNSLALIQAAGLGHTLAFYYNKKRKNERAYELLYNHIDEWLKKRLTNNQDSLKWIIKGASSIKVLQATREVIALLNWMKRFAEAELEEVT